MTDPNDANTEVRAIDSADVTCTDIACGSVTHCEFVDGVMKLPNKCPICGGRTIVILNTHDVTNEWIIPGRSEGGGDEGGGNGEQ